MELREQVSEVYERRLGCKSSGAPGCCIWMKKASGMEKRKQLIANFVEHRSPVGGGVVDQAQARGETQPVVDPKAVATLIVAALE